jgi:iron complex transport system substrate-binding protein
VVRGGEGKGSGLTYPAFIPGFHNEGRGFFMRIRIKNKKLKMIIYVCLLLTVYCLLFTVSYAEQPQRIVSLAPGITEILYKAGLGNRIVGVTTFCDFPENARLKPKVGGMTNPSLEAVVRLRPDIVILTTDGNPKEFEYRLRSMGIRTYVFESLTIPELPEGLRKMGRVLEEYNAFDSLASGVEKAIKKFEKNKIAGNKKVLFIVWPEPLIVAGPGTAINDAIHMIGAVNISDAAKSRYPKYSVEEVLRRSPDAIFIGKGMGEDHKNLEKISAGLLKKLSSIPAVKNGRVFFVSDSLYRLGPRVVQGIEELAEKIEGVKGSGGQGFER